MAAVAPTLRELFDPDFLKALQLFRLRARRVAVGGRHAEQDSSGMGYGLEFKDFRPYVAGDDLRAVDWNIYRRLGKVVVKVFEEQQDLPLYLMPDVSRSMFLEDPPRIHSALRVSLALAAVSLGQHDSIGLFPFADDLQVRVKSMSGKGGVMSFARHLSQLEERGQTELSTAVKRFSDMSLRRGLLVIISDFFEAGGVARVLDSLSGCRHDLLLIQLVRESDAKPAPVGDVRLRDCETNEVVNVSVTAEVLNRYREAYEDFSEELATFARERQAGLLRLDAEQDVLGQLGSLFESGVLRI